MVGVGVTCGERQQVEFLEEFLRRPCSLTQERQLVLGVGLLIGVLEGFFAFLLEVLKCSPPGKTHSNDLIDEISRKLFWQSSCKEAEVESDSSGVIESKFVEAFFIVKELLSFKLFPVFLRL